MLNRLIIHIRNLIISIKWIFNRYIEFKNHLEDRGYYALSLSKIWLWKEDSKYFTVYNTDGDCFFVKIKTEKSVLYEYELLNYISSKNISKDRFYPEIVETNTADFNYNIYKNINGKKMSRSSFKISFIDQMRRILVFLKEHKIIHRDIRPHNILLDRNNIILLDFEHCVINGQSNEDITDLNKEYRPSEHVWDDSFSFKKIIDKYSNSKKIKNNESYIYISNMIGDLEYESA